jgi:adenylylsulfate kinase-like enzyme
MLHTRLPEHESHAGSGIEKPRVLLVNGPAGVGKTTTSTLLARSAVSGACIHGDDLRNFIVRSTPDVMGRMTYRNGGSVAANFIRAGYELVVFEYIFPNADAFVTFAETFDADAHVHAFTLWAPLHVVRRRELSRSGREALGDRVIDCYRELEANLARLGTIVDTDGVTPEHLVQRILESSERGEGRLETLPPVLARAS